MSTRGRHSLYRRQWPRQLILWMIVCGCFFSGQSFAAARVLGPTYAIAETDFLVYVKTVLTPKKRRLIQRALARQIEQVMKKPQIHYRLPRAQKTQQRIVDPTVWVSSIDQVKQQVSQVQYKTSAIKFFTPKRVNPLALIHLTYRLVFINALDPKQVNWLKRQLRPSDKIILSAGRPLLLSRQLAHPVFIDVQGILAHRFKLTALPSVVKQAGLKLSITEYAV